PSRRIGSSLAAGASLWYDAGGVRAGGAGGRRRDRARPPPAARAPARATRQAAAPAHVARAGGADAACELVWSLESHRVRRTANLEAADRLQVLQLDVHIRGVGLAKAQQRRAERDAAKAASRRPDVVQGDGVDGPHARALSPGGWACRRRWPPPAGGSSVPRPGLRWPGPAT